MEVYVDPAATGANDGTSWTDAYTDFESAVAVTGAGDTIHCRGTQTLSSAIDGEVTGSSDAAYNNRAYVIGYNSSGVEDGTQFVLDGNSSATNCMTNFRGYWVFRNIKFTGATGDGLALTASCQSTTFFNCSFDGNGGSGFGDGSTKNDRNLFINCTFNNNTDEGLSGVYQSTVLLCEAIGNGNDGFQGITTGRSAAYIFCIAHNNTADGFQLYGYGDCVVGCVTDGNANGVNIASGLGLLAFSRFTHNSSNGVNAGTSFDLFIGYFNAFYNNTTKINGEYEEIDGQDTDMSGDGYTARGSDDFSLADSAEARRHEIKVGYLGP